MTWMMLILASHSVAFAQISPAECNRIRDAFIKDAFLQVDSDAGLETVVSVQCVETHEQEQQPVG